MTNSIRTQIGNTYEVAVQSNEMAQSLERGIAKERVHLWLRAPCVSTNHNAAKQKQQEGTGSWFIAGQNYLSWRDTVDGHIWLHGIPGCGKTILWYRLSIHSILFLANHKTLYISSSTIIDNLREHCGRTEKSRLAYYYFTFNESLEYSAETLVRSLISQLIAHRPLPLALEALYTHCQDGAEQPCFKELLSILRVILTEEFTTFIVIDALDECMDREDLMSFLHTMLSWPGLRIHLLCASRKERDIEEAFKGSNMDLIAVERSDITDDIELYIRARFQADIRLRKWPPNVQREMMEALMAGANGMFRWVACQIDSLRKCLRLDLLRKTLKSLPKTLEDTYNRIILEIDEAYRQDAFKILQWIAFSARPLQLREIAEVIAIDVNAQEDYFSVDRRLPEPRDLLVICSSLVTIVEVQFESRGVIERIDELRLAHFSVKEYLTSSTLASSSAAIFAITEIPASTFIADSCLAYILNFCTQMSLHEDPLRSFPLIRYAAKHWVYHASRVGNIEPNTSLWKHIVDLFLLERRYFNNWIRVWNPDEPEAKPNLTTQPECIATAVYYAALCGLHIALRQLVAKQVDLNVSGGLYGTALQAAATLGRLEIVKLLLFNGAKCNAYGGFHGSPLSAASFNGHIDIVRLLLSHGADVLYHDGSGRTALSWAAEGNSVDVIEVLADAGSKIDSQDLGLRTPLIWAAAHGASAPVAKALIMRSAKIEATDKNGLSPLIWAAKKGHESDVRLLLGYGADIHLKDVRGQTALHWAAKRGHTFIIDLLLQNGAVVNEEDHNSQTPLWWAKRRSHQDVVDLLLRSGATSGDTWWGESVKDWKLLMQDNNHYQRILASSLRGDYEAILRYLLSASGNVEARGENGQTPLLWAADEGEEAAVKLLINEFNADIEAKDSSGQTALLCAAKRNFATILSDLLSKQPDLETRDMYWLQTPLAWATKRGNLEPVKLLLHRGADINTRNRHGQTPLMLAATRGYRDLVQIFIEKGASMEEKDVNGLTAAACALKSGHKEISDVLLQALSRAHHETYI